MLMLPPLFGRIATQYIHQLILGCIQLLFSRRTFALGKIAAAQSRIAQAADFAFIATIFTGAA